MELRQLRYFVAVAEELHFGRAAQRLLISGPALSQQIIALERDLGVELLVRDRRTVALTAAGRSLLDDARQLLAAAEATRERLRHRATASPPLRLGYVSWLPADLPAALGSAGALRVDEWVLPSHTQADRVADGTLDLALAWVSAAAARHRRLRAELLHAEALQAVSAAAGAAQPVDARRLTVVIDADESAWSSWNLFATEFAADTGAALSRIDDGGITGDAFYGHVRRLRTAVLASPKRHTAALPPRMRRRPVQPTPIWAWSLLTRDDDDRPAVRQVVDALTRYARHQGWTAAPPASWWAPADDPHRHTYAR